jgi:hypothetical protein
MNDTIEHNTSTTPTATRWVIDALAPLRERLTTWPAVLPTAVGDPVRPLKIGVYDDLLALLPNGEGHETLSRVLRRYTRSTQYLTAPGAMRHDLAGNPIEPVADEHKTPVRPISKAVPSPTPQRQETIVVSVKIKALKVTAVVPPADLKPVPAGADVVLALEVGDGMKAEARLNPKSYRKALATIAELGVENVAVIVQGQMTRPGVIESAGIVAQPKKPKE